MAKLKPNRASQPSKTPLSPALFSKRNSTSRTQRLVELLKQQTLSSQSLSSQSLNSSALEESTEEESYCYKLQDSLDDTNQRDCHHVEATVGKVTILGVDFDNFSMQELLHRLHRGIIFTPNVDHLMKLRSDPEFAQVYKKADFKVCDSQIVMYASKFLGKGLKEKLSGSDLFPLFCEHHKHNENVKIFLLGGKEGIAQKARERVNQRIGREIVVGEYSPPFGFERSQEECERIVDCIQVSDANVVAVCLGAPKQEKWIAAYCDRLPNIDIFMAVGAVVDFEAGTKPRAPKYVSELGLEWLYRLVCEPRRLWRRYLLEDIPFVGLVLAEKFRQMTTAGRSH